MGLLYITVVMNVMVLPLQQFVPDVGKSHLGVGAALVGLLVASQAMGQVISAGIMASLRSLGHHGRVFVVGSVTVLVMAVFFVWSPWYVLSFAFLLALGIGQAGFGTMQTTITMLSAPPEMWGRMMGLLDNCIGIASPVGALEIGIVAAAFSTQWAISVNAVIGLMLFLPALMLNSPCLAAGPRKGKRNRSGVNLLQPEDGRYLTAVLDALVGAAVLSGPRTYILPNRRCNRRHQGSSSCRCHGGGRASNR